MMKSFSEFTSGSADAKPTTGFPSFTQVREGEDSAPKCMSESMMEKMNEMYESMCKEMKACHEDETEHTAESYMKECDSMMKEMMEKMNTECESYMSAMH